MTNMDEESGMNKIAEIRGGLSLEKVALACEPPTTPKQISRLEKGERRLTTDWMERLAGAFTRLGISTTPSDLLPDSFIEKPATSKEERILSLMDSVKQDFQDDPFVSPLLQSIEAYVKDKEK